MNIVKKCKPRTYQLEVTKDGAPYEVNVSCTVLWSQGKRWRYIKFLPIAIKESGGVLQFEKFIDGKPFT